MNPPSTTLTLIDGVKVVVPDSLHLITPYVLAEQQDWFEDEIKFLRHALGSGQKIIDIGANYGVYTLSMAKSVGPAGHIWAFEPASSTAAFLSASVRTNDFPQVTVIQSALSNAPGSAQLAVGTHAELNALVGNGPAGEGSETVDLTTLDLAAQAHGWTAIDFLKIDAEGEESKILEGGRNFFSSCAPLVQYEVKAGREVHLGLVNEFSELGYQSYRLVPGLNVLVPFDASSAVDGFLLNLFACNTERASALSRHGLLVTTAQIDAARLQMRDAQASAGGAFLRPWRDALCARPYAQGLALSWRALGSTAPAQKLDEAMSLYAFAHSTDASTADRVVALERAYTTFFELCDEQSPPLGHLSSLARVALELGHRSVAVATLSRVVAQVQSGVQLDAAQPFLAPSPSVEPTMPPGSLGAWFMCAVIETFERLNSFSSFYTGAAAKGRLELIAQMGYGSAEMNRRLQLVQRRFG